MVHEARRHIRLQQVCELLCYYVVSGYQCGASRCRTYQRTHGVDRPNLPTQVLRRVNHAAKAASMAGMATTHPQHDRPQAESIARDLASDEPSAPSNTKSKSMRSFSLTIRQADLFHIACINCQIDQDGIRWYNRPNGKFICGK